MHILLSNDDGYDAEGLRRHSDGPRTDVVDHTAYAYDALNRPDAYTSPLGETISVVYDNRDMSNHMANCILHNGRLFGFDGNSNHSRTVNELAELVLCQGAVGSEHRWV